MDPATKAKRSTSATIRDVAAASGVSVSTVSLTLNHPNRVAESTRRRVLAAADQLGFVPKAEAVASARRGVGRIGVVGPFSAYSAAARRLAGVLSGQDDTTFEVVVFDQESSARTMSPLLASLPRTGRLDGLLIVSSPLDESLVARLRQLDLPTVLVDGRHPSLSSVRTDDVAGGAMAARHLLSRGHRRCAFMGEEQRSLAYVSPTQRRLEGYRAVLGQAHRNLPEEMTTFAGHGLPAATAAARDLLDRPDRPGAVFAAADLLAAGVLRAARQLGLRVPDDVAVIGYDDGDLAEALDLTTVRQPLEATGRLALEQLQALSHRRGAASPVRDTVLELTLIERDTT